MLLIGLIILVVGISDFVIAAVLARQQAAATGGLGASEPQPVVRILRRSGAVTVLLGAVLTLVGLLG